VFGRAPLHQSITGVGEAVPNAPDPLTRRSEAEVSLVHFPGASVEVLHLLRFASRTFLQANKYVIYQQMPPDTPNSQPTSYRYFLSPCPYSDYRWRDYRARRRTQISGVVAPTSGKRAFGLDPLVPASIWAGTKDPATSPQNRLAAQEALVPARNEPLVPV
jgi:hypothetical protein